MGREIERKFIVAGQGWREGATGIPCRQGYLSVTEDCVVRIRTAGGRASLTVKGRKTGLSCPEYDFEIPLREAEELLERICRPPLIEKIRYTLDFKGTTWEIDEFKGENEGLIVAEVELDDENQHIEIPEWAGCEVSLDPKYRNVNLTTCPYYSWTREMKRREAIVQGPVDHPFMPDPRKGHTPLPPGPCKF